ncbi:MAG: T9SS type A sorting domain-containing protein [Saprospiraceae bacterium]
MKRGTFTFLLACLFFLQGTAQQVEEVQRSLLTKRAATWCPPCGGWGWDFFDNLLEDNAGKAVFFDAHYSGILEAAVSNDLTTNFGGLFQPEFFLNENKIDVLPGNAVSMREEVQNQVAASFSIPPVANTGFFPVYENGAINVDATVKFFQAAQGEFYLGIYLIEDHVIEFQQGQGNDADHRKILRESFTTSSWGKPIANGSVSAGSEFAIPFSLLIGDPAGHNYEIAGVIWKKEGNKYHLVNVWSTTAIGIATATGEVSAVDLFEVTPNLVTEAALIKIEMKENAAASIDLVDLNGKTVREIFAGNLASGSHTFTVSASEKGLYFVRLRANGTVGTRKVVFQ